MEESNSDDGNNSDKDNGDQDYSSPDQRKQQQTRAQQQPWLDLLDPVSSNLLQRRGRPLYSKVEMYRYEMAAPLWEIAPNYLRVFLGIGNSKDEDNDKTPVQWWNRYYEENLIPVVSFDQEQKQFRRAAVLA